MENVIVYNVLFKGVENNPSNLNWCKCFGNYENADKFMVEYADKRGLKFCSEMGWTKGSNWEVDEMTIGAMNDHRLECKNGNTYYFVIYVQEVKVSHKLENA